MKNLVLVGFMGSGKSAVARRVAAPLGLNFLDTDHEIERREGRRVSEIFAKEGESHFRCLEQGLTTDLARQSDLVIATGGGIVLDERNIAALRNSGVVIALGVSPATVLSRVGHQTHRPLLEGADKALRIETILAQREPLYRAAGFYIETDGKTIEQISNEVIAAYRAQTAPGL